MRQIKFRGKRADNGEWVYGYLAEIETAWDYYNGHGLPTEYKKVIIRTDIVVREAIEIIPETVGQFTGLCDKNGKEIYEGDVLRDAQGWIFEVRWDNDNGRFLGYHSKPRGDTYICYVGRVDKCNNPSTEVVGNIHNNPELLEVQND